MSLSSASLVPALDYSILHPIVAQHSALGQSLSTQKCTLCNTSEKAFLSFAGLQHHMTHFHNLRECCTCGLCGRTFVSREALKGHAHCQSFLPYINVSLLQGDSTALSFRKRVRNLDHHDCIEPCAQCSLTISQLFDTHRSIARLGGMNAVKQMRKICSTIASNGVSTLLSDAATIPTLQTLGGLDGIVQLKADNIRLRQQVRDLTPSEGSKPCPLSRKKRST